jgi:TldD protein
MELSAAIVVTGSKDGKTEIQSRNWSNNHDYGRWLNQDEEIRKLTDLVLMYLDADDVKSGIYPVVCGPSQTGLFVHEAFGHLSESDKVYKNESLRNIMKLGRVFGPEILNITDSGMDHGQRGSLVYDDEGVKTQKTYLIRNGVLEGRLHSRQTAGIMGEKPTGNARAISYVYPPIVRMRNTSIEPGESSLDDIISSTGLGIYAKRSKGGQTGGEMFTFSPAETYYIRNGKVAEPVRNVTFTGNLFLTLRNIEMIGDDYQISSGNCGKGEQFPLPVSFSGPHIKINSVTVGGSK